ncbi:MAG TPA: hypothetical protein VHG91_13985 [Longimicrobium sp.]|nr:hypothetical protein [Longimicrobium sp.]
MRKIVLSPDELRVESFATGASPSEGGTVVGREAPPTIMPNCGTVLESCAGCSYDDTCGA